MIAARQSITCELDRRRYRFAGSAVESSCAFTATPLSMYFKALRR
ncbi:hypothetical protein XHC_2255 [Xanthomonas hortorum pv. carotae str. M081]|nr:hypothetical protein XHC_2255 [Xanthomonas hortorum pv. carotae str. M081]